MRLNRIREIGIGRTIKKVSFYDEVYAIGIRPLVKAKTQLIDTSVAFSLLPEEKDVWMADPLIYTHEGNDWLFVESFSKRDHRGSISVIDLNASDRQYKPVSVIEENYHMSFPMVFKWNDGIYMIPETSENHSVNLYQCTGFPYQWKLVSSFHTDRLIVDSVIIGSTDDTLTLLASESSPENPLYVRFVRYTISCLNGSYAITFEPADSSVYTLDQRMGGNPMLIRDSLYYVTQTSTDIDYGVSVSLSLLKDHRVSPVQTLDRDTVDIQGIRMRDVIGIHTYSKGIQYEVIDLRYLKFDPLLNVRRIAYLFGKSS